MHIQAGKIDQDFLNELEQTWEADTGTTETFEPVYNREKGRGDSKRISDPKERRKQRDERIKRQSKFHKLDMEIG